MIEDESSPTYQIGKTLWELEIQLNEVLENLRKDGYQGSNTLTLVKASIADCLWIKDKFKELKNG